MSEKVFSYILKVVILNGSSPIVSVFTLVWYVMKFSSSHLPALSSAEEEEGWYQTPTPLLLRYDVRSQQLDFEMTWPKYTFVILKWARCSHCTLGKIDLKPLS